MPLNANLHEARRNPKDEFYTRLEDIENELRHYTDHFKSKVVYCNCDDPTVSQFFEYFSLKFDDLGLKKLITTCYKSQTPDLFSQHDSERAIMLEYDGFRDGDVRPRVEDIGIKHLQGNGDFQSQECINILKQADIVVTNPPFSLFRQYISNLMKHDKKFLIIGPRNAITYKDIFPIINDNRLWLGYGFEEGNAYFAVESGREYAAGVYDEKTGLVKFRNVTWFTNLDHKKRHEELILYRRYTPEDYPSYNGYDIINVDKIDEIPMDWDGVMGVPITFLDKHNPDQFELLGIANSARWIGHECFTLLGRRKVYNRILIRRR